MKTLKMILLFIWELPQNIIGAILLLVVRIFKLYRKETIYSPWIVYEKDRLFIECKDFGISLGFFIFWRDSTQCANHEYGHSIQSNWWGWFYLITVGLISFARATYVWFRYKLAENLSYSEGYHLTRELTKWYYTGYPEKQADKLGGVNRWE